jgi:hypothetical protein
MTTISLFTPLPQEPTTDFINCFNSPLRQIQSHHLINNSSSEHKLHLGSSASMGHQCWNYIRVWVHLLSCPSVMGQAQLMTINTQPHPILGLGFFPPIWYQTFLHPPWPPPSPSPPAALPTSRQCPSNRASPALCSLSAPAASRAELLQVFDDALQRASSVPAPPACPHLGLGRRRSGGFPRRRRAPVRLRAALRPQAELGPHGHA